MSKKKIIILAIILLSFLNILLSFFIFIGEGAKEISINSRNENTSIIKNDTSANKYIMEFTATNNLMNKLRISCKIPDLQKSKGFLYYKLYEKESAIVIAKGKQEISNIMIRGEISILFENQIKSAGTKYVLEFYLEEAPENLKWIIWANNLNSESLKVDLISSASYATKTKPFLWDSLLIFAFVIYISVIVFYKEEKDKQNE